MPLTIGTLVSNFVHAIPTDPVQPQAVSDFVLETVTPGEPVIPGNPIAPQAQLVGGLLQGGDLSGPFVSDFLHTPTSTFGDGFIVT